MSKIEVKFRLANQNDIDFIFHSLREMASEEGISERFSQTPASISQALFSEHRFAEVLIAECEQNPMGLCLFSTTNRNFTVFAAPGLYIHDIVVGKSYRKLGVGNRLVQELKNIARKRQLKRIDWVVLKDNINALKFWRNMPDAKSVDYVEYMRISL